MKFFKGITAPTQIIVDEIDYDVPDLNRKALEQMTHTKELIIVKDAAHLFEEPGTSEKVAKLSGEWLVMSLHDWWVELHFSV